MKIPARAKINLTLEVLGDRPDGYHDLHSVVMPVSVADSIVLEHSDASSPSLSVTAADGAPVDLTKLGPPEKNLAVKAALVLAAETQHRPCVSISIEKRIPLGGGLGGGSADAAAVLVGLNDLWDLGLTRLELATIGAFVGSDVPALALGGAVLMEGRGERVSPLFPEGTTDIPPIDLVLVNPGVFSSTPAVFKANRNTRLTNDARILDNIRQSLAAGDVEGVSRAMDNDLADAARTLYPEIGQAEDALRAAGAVGVLMSGSGATVFGLVRSPEHGREVVDRLAGSGFKTALAHTCPVV